MSSEIKYIGYVVLKIADIFDLTTHLSCLLGGKVIRANAYLSPKVNCHSSAPYF